MMEVLTPAQIGRYAKLRGYASAGPSAHGAGAGHQKDRH
jgi:hypothetical protein